MKRFTSLLLLVFTLLSSQRSLAVNEGHTEKALMAAHQTGIISARVTRFVMVNKSTSNIFGLQSKFSDEELKELYQQLSKQYKIILIPIIVEKFAIEFNDEELKQIIEKSEAATHGKFDARLTATIIAIQEGIEDKAKDLGTMVTLLYAEFLCLKNPPKKGCPPKRYF